MSMSLFIPSLYCLLPFHLVLCCCFKAQGGLLWISSDRDDQIGAKKQNTEKSLDQNLTPKQSHAEFPNHKNFQKALNDFLAQKNRNISFEHPKNSLFNQASPKKLAKIILPEKIPKIKNFKPKKILQSTLTLEIRSIPHSTAGF